MKYLVVSDVHGNYPALKAIYDKELDNVDGVICVGDIVGLMGFPSETAELIMNKSTYAVKGNHDISVLERGEGHVNSPELSTFELDINMNDLSSKQVDWISNLSPLKRVPDKGLLIAHAQPKLSLASGIELGNRGIPKGKYISVASNVNDEEYDFVILGHTHEPAVVDCNKFGHNIIVLNPGSAGQPVDSNANYAIIDTDNKTAELHNVEYDGEEVKNKIESLNVPLKWW